MTELTDREKIAAAIANARGGRRGMPPIINILEILPEKLKLEVLDDADAVLAAFRVPQQPLTYLTLPANIEQAEAMQKLGRAWLRQHAPDRLTKIEDERMLQWGEFLRAAVDAVYEQYNSVADAYAAFKKQEDHH